jgi:hypothetical protein
MPAGSKAQEETTMQEFVSHNYRVWLWKLLLCDQHAELATGNASNMSGCQKAAEEQPMHTCSCKGYFQQGSSV